MVAKDGNLSTIEFCWWKADMSFHLGEKYMDSESKVQRLCHKWYIWGLIFFLMAAMAGANASNQTALQNCATQFIGGDPYNAPNVLGSEPGQPFERNSRLCYRDDDTSFFAIEYWPDEFAPRWAAYKLSKDNYGDDGCKTYTRNSARCYFAKNSWAEVVSCVDASDPFHEDIMLNSSKLGKHVFSNTGHDIGHIAPRQAFSWNVCATYQTYTMANMSPQRALLNQKIWFYLERQILTWGFDIGPLYVVSGTVYETFPHSRFRVYSDGTFDSDEIYAPGITLKEVATRHAENYSTYPLGHRLRPLRDAKPESVKSKTREMRMPTGYYKVVFRPEIGQESAHAIGFMLPHTYEDINKIKGVPQKESFWAFVSRIDVIEEVSGTRFPGIPQKLKKQWGDPYFLAKRTGRNIRSSACGKGSPKGVLPDSTQEERILVCTDQLQQVSR